MIKILLADDHPLTRVGLKTWIDGEPDLQLVSEVEDGESAVIEIAQTKPDIALIDIEMPSCNGMEVTERVVKAAMSVRVIILTAYSSQQYVMAALRAGAAGFVLKTAPFKQLRKAIHDVYDGGFYLDSSVSLGEIANTEREPLSAREKEVLVCTAQGIIAQDVAEALSITERTVQAHLTSVYSKLNAKNKTEAILIALKNGIIFLDQLQINKNFGGRR
jgi:DNA-binding NarL/FixJ family response regulator